MAIPLIGMALTALRAAGTSAARKVIAEAVDAGVDGVKAQAAAKIAQQGAKTKAGAATKAQADASVAARKTIGNTLLNGIDKAIGVANSPAKVQLATNRIVGEIGKREANNVAKATRAAIRSEATEQGLTGAARKAYIKENAGRASIARAEVNQKYQDITTLTNGGALKLGESVASRIRDTFLTRGLDAAEKDLAKYLSRHISNTASDIRRGKMYGVEVAVDTSNRADLLAKMITKVAAGGSPTATAREVLEDRVTLHTKGKTYTGKEAVKLAKGLGLFNKTLTDIDTLTQLKDANGELKDVKNGSKIDRIMRRFYERNSDDEYIDDNGNVVTFDDLKVILEDTRTIDPMAVRGDLEEATAREINRVTALANSRNEWARRLEKSLRSATMDVNSPDLFNDIIEAAGKMSVGALHTLMMSGQIDGHIVYLSSDAYTIVANARELVRGVGLNPDNYTFDQLNFV